jgi:hypothetical protein
VVAPTSIYSHEEIMNVRTVAVEWAKEIGFHWDQLEHQIVVAWLHGEFDEPGDKHGFYMKSPQTKRIAPVAGAEAAASLSGPDFDSTLWWWKHAQMLVIHRDAVIAFAKKRARALPTWWNPALTEIAVSRLVATGRKPKVTERVKAEMRIALSQGVILADMMHKEMETEFQASPYTCEKARKIVLAEAKGIPNK